MQDKNIKALRAAIEALEGQRATLGEGVVEMATSPLRARLASLLRTSGLRHRQVTVMFADVVGSTALAESLEAEDTLQVLSGAMERMAAVVQAHEGRVLQFTGDGLKAVFGMDEKREDDAARAVRAGLAILQAGREQAQAVQRQFGIAGFALRVGVHTGDVALGAGVEDDDTAIGAAVNIAARMEQSAPPGRLRISHDSWSQVRGLFDVEPQPPLAVKGVAAPMQTYLVLAARDHSVAEPERGLQGLRTAMVGRQAELQRLHALIEHARQTRQPQGLTVLADAGLGKSRLLREALADLQGCQRLAGRAQPDGMLRPWGLLRSLMAAQCGVADTDSAETARRKFVDQLGPCFAERGERQAQLIGQLIGLDFGDSPHVRGLDPRALRDQAWAAVVHYLQGLAAQSGRLPVLVVEDLHWADDGSLDLLQHLLAQAGELPLALLMSARPTLLARRPDWGPPGSLVPLGPLAAAEGDELVRALLQRMAMVPPELVQRITGQAEGNPYYMEELVRRLIDDGVIAVDGLHWALQAGSLQALRLPTTLVGLLQARLDALPAREHQAVRQASIIGHVFWDDALRALDERAPLALPALQHAALVRERETSDFEGTAERQFDHHLLHQVTYDTLLKAERRIGHGAAARWLAERTSGRGAEFLAMTGEHAERAGETALAIDCFEQAGQQAQCRFANAAAQTYYRRALALLGEADPGRTIDLLNEVERIADTIGDRATQDAVSHEVAVLLERHPDAHRQARLLWSRALLADRRGDSATSERLARQAGALAESCGHARWAAMSQAQLAWLHMVRQDYAGAQHHIENGLSWAVRIEVERTRAETEAQLLTLKGMVSILHSQLADARITLTAVLARGEWLGSPRLQLGALDNLALVDTHLGRWHEVQAWGERMRTLARSIGSRSDIAGSQLHLAKAAHTLGDAAAARCWYEENLLTYRATGNRRLEAITLRLLCALHLQQGDAQAAADYAAEALALHQNLEEPNEACETMACHALCAARCGQRAEALRRLDATLDRMRDTLAQAPAIETLDMRWACHQVMRALDDARAKPLLDQLLADVQARATAVTDAADHDRLIAAIPLFGAIVAAHRQLSAAG